MLLALFLLTAVPAVTEAGVPPPAATEPELAEELITPPAPEVVLTRWDEAVGRLRARSVELRTALAQLELAGAQARLTLSPLLPEVRASLSAQQRLAGRNSLTIEGGDGNVDVDEDADESRPTSPLVSLRASAVQTVLNVPAWQALSAARARERAVHASARDTWRLLVRELARGLVAVVAAERVVELNRMGLTQALARHRLTQEAEQLGSGRKLDTLRTGRDLELARAELLSSVESLRRARDGLGLALGADAEVGLAPGFRLDGLRDELATLCRPLRGEPRADLVAASQQLQAAEREVAGARAAYVPTLGLQSSLTALSVDPGVARVSTWNIAAVLEVPIWDGGTRGATVRAERANLAVAGEQLESVRRTLGVEVARARRGVALAEALRVAARRARDAASQTDTLTQEAFREGVATSLELVQSAEELREAERTLALRELDLVQARVEALMVEAECPL
ncbi:TolC family protein [Archangium violaceum]|uniref:TolC family protein n=1 Tax=Archangium violaceum TaxID=83451 RepID=UPI00194ED06F|nr:TolC family protein [Archangium violaceum]QRO00629.1 TolC family protein [Archangium violaceum]